MQRGESSKRQLFLQKMQTQEPVTLSNLQVASSNMVFLNRGTVIQDAPPHSIQFLFQPLAPMTSTPVDTILKNHNSGNFTVSGCIKWLGEPFKPEHATKMVREAEITDPTGTINLSVWDSHIQQIEDNQFYTVTNCKLFHMVAGSSLFFPMIHIKYVVFMSLWPRTFRILISN